MARPFDSVAELNIAIESINCLPCSHAAGFFYRSQVTGHRSQVTGHRSKVTGYRSQVTGQKNSIWRVCFEAQNDKQNLSVTVSFYPC